MVGSERNRTRTQTLIVGALAIATLAVVLGRQSILVAITAAALSAAGIWLMLRRQSGSGPHTGFSQARQRIAPGHAVVFWKPTCAYCERLLRALRDDPRVTWVNVWQDDEANRVVRSHNNGNELVPTALVGDVVLINPSAAELKAALG